MKKIALFSTLLLACGDDYMPETVQKISQAQCDGPNGQCGTKDARLTFNYRLQYNGYDGWDGLLYNGTANPNVGSRRVTNANRAQFPSLWVLVCHDPNCTSGNVEAQYFNVTPTIADMHHENHYPADNVPYSVEYDIHNNGYTGCIDPTSPPGTCAMGIPVWGGDNYYWIGLRCAEGYTQGGDTGMTSGVVSMYTVENRVISVNGSTYAGVAPPYGSGPHAANARITTGAFGAKDQWARAISGCSGVLTGDFWNVSNLSFQWCDMCAFGQCDPQGCYPGSRHYMSTSWQ